MIKLCDEMRGEGSVARLCVLGEGSGVKESDLCGDDCVEVRCCLLRCVVVSLGVSACAVVV